LDKILKQRNLNDDQDEVSHAHQEEQKLLGEESRVESLNKAEDPM
jgi:hypothetical protein